MQKGVTLLEILVVMSVLSVLFAVGFVLSEPMRESARVASCKGNLMQIYRANILYAADHGSDTDLPGFQNLSLYALINPRRIMPYLSDSSVLFCPSCPAFAKTRLLSSYSYPPLEPAYHRQPSAGMLQVIEEERIEARREGGNHSIIRCFIHDQVYYQPKETDQDFALRQPFVVDVLANGSVRSGRRNFLSSSSLSGWSR